MSAPAEGRRMLGQILKAHGAARESDIQRALAESSHPLAGFARHLIDQWDHAETDDRVAGLLLLGEITLGRPQPGPGVVGIILEDLRLDRTRPGNIRLPSIP